MGDDTFTDEQASEQEQPNWSKRRDQIRNGMSRDLAFRQAGSLIEGLAAEYAVLEQETGGVVDYNSKTTILHLMARASRRRQEINIDKRTDEQLEQERDIDDMGGISSWMSERIGGPFAQGMGEGIEQPDPDIDVYSGQLRAVMGGGDEHAQSIQPGPMRDGPWLARCDLEAFWYVMVWGGDAYSKSELNRMDVPTSASYQAGIVGPRSIKAGQYCQYNPATGHVEACPSPEPASSDKPDEVAAGEEGALNRLETLLRRERDEAEARRRGVVRQSTPAGSRYAMEALPPIDTSEGASNLRQFPNPLKGVEDIRDATL